MKLMHRVRGQTPAFWGTPREKKTKRRGGKVKRETSHSLGKKKEGTAPVPKRKQHPERTERDRGCWSGFRSKRVDERKKSFFRPMAGGKRPPVKKGGEEGAGPLKKSPNEGSQRSPEKQPKLKENPTTAVTG